MATPKTGSARKLGEEIKLNLTLQFCSTSVEIEQSKIIFKSTNLHRLKKDVERQTYMQEKTSHSG